MGLSPVGARCTVQGPRCTLQGARCNVHGGWCGVGARCTVHIARCTLQSARCTVQVSARVIHPQSRDQVHVELRSKNCSMNTEQASIQSTRDRVHKELRSKPTLLLYALYTKQESFKTEYILYIQEQVRRCDQRSSDPIEASKVPPKHRVAKIVLN